MAVPSLLDFINKRRSTQSPDDAYQLDQQQPRTVATKQYELPKIDSNDAIGSLAGVLGPTPEERAAEEQRLQEHRRKMHGWTALFNGLRHLSNLYYATKGARGQKYNDPHQQIEQQYQEERKRLADIQAQNQKYYAGLWGMYRQINDEQRRNALAEAQAQYYGTRDEVARQKAEIDRLNSLLKGKEVKMMQNGSLILIDKEAGTAEEIKASDPLYEELMQSKINKNNRTDTRVGSSGRSNGNYGYKITRHVDPSTGDVITERVPTTGKNDNSKKYSKYKNGNAGNGNAANKWNKYLKK